MGNNKKTSSKKYISLEDFHNISNISLNTIKRNVERIPGIEKEKESFRVLRGTRYPANMRRFKSNEFARKRYQLLKAICEDRYVDEVMLRCDELQFEDFIKECGADLEITGIRKAEVGIRSANYKTCCSESKSKGCDTYRPVFWYTDSDKTGYEEFFGVTHSKCYTEYGLKRTGCVGCPFSKHINEELAIIEEHEPNLYKAAVHIFGKSYEYTAKYRAFAKEMKAREKEAKKRGLSCNIGDNFTDIPCAV